MFGISKIKYFVNFGFIKVKMSFRKKSYFAEYKLKAITFAFKVNKTDNLNSNLKTAQLFNLNESLIRFKKNKNKLTITKRD